tara:strand:+ start:1013 stop:1231 length:219 start_codon:yes stop_codon:yes gene_type:complete
MLAGSKTIKGDDMGMMFSDFNKALSAKSCYSKFLLSSAVFVLTVLLSVSFFVQEPPRGDKNTPPIEKTALLE